MKIRTGFVSNSSSSSFVIALPHKPKDVEDLKHMLFGKQEWFYTGYSFEDEDPDVPTQKLAESVFGKIKKKATIKEMTESLCSGWFSNYMGILPGHYDYSEDSEYKALDRKDPDFSKKMDAVFAKVDKINKERAKNIIDFFRESNKDRYLVVMEFSDNDGEEVEEHAGIFERVDSIVTSYH